MRGHKYIIRIAGEEITGTGRDNKRKAMREASKRYPEHEMWVTESQAKAWAVYQLQGKFLVHIRSENKV